MAQPERCATEIIDTPQIRLIYTGRSSARLAKPNRPQMLWQQPPFFVYWRTSSVSNVNLLASSKLAYRAVLYNVRPHRPHRAVVMKMGVANRLPQGHAYVRIGLRQYGQISLTFALGPLSVLPHEGQR